MHFVINVFVTAVCFISIILFKEILNKIVKVLLSVIGCGTLSYALAILVKKCGEWFGCWSGDAQYAIDHHYPSICIYYDYEGIEKWATGLWKANKEQTQNYVKTINDMKKKIDIYFLMDFCYCSSCL